jgi:peroxin-4
MSLVSKRLDKEWRDIKSHSNGSETLQAEAVDLPYSSPLPESLALRFPTSEILLFPRSSTFLWTALINGPKDTPFESARWELAIHVPTGYPHSPPSVTFVTPIFHPNVDFKTGEICLDVLKTSWVASWTLEAVCRAVAVLLGAPQADSPLNCDAGIVLRSGDLRGYWAAAKMHALDYALLLPMPDDLLDDAEDGGVALATPAADGAGSEPATAAAAAPVATAPPQ